MKNFNVGVFRLLVSTIKKSFNKDSDAKKERIDIIKMYNNIFIEVLYQFIDTLNSIDKDIKVKLFTPIFNLMFMDNEMSTLLACLQDDYNIIYSYSPKKVPATRTEYLGNKRIRQLTPPFNSKIMSYSPFSKKSSFTPIRNNLPGKDLKNVFKVGINNK